MLEERDGENQRSPSESSESKLPSLVESELRYRRLFETAQDGILIIDSDTERIMDANPFVTKILGCSRDEMVGRKLWEIGPLVDASRSKIAFDELKTKGYIRYEDLPLEAKDGRRIDVELMSSVYAVDGTKVIQCFIRDITEQKRAEEALRKSEEQYRLLIERQKEGLTIIDLEERFVFCNPAGEEVFGVPRGGLVGRNVREFTTLEAFELIRKQTEKRRSGESSSYEIEITRPDGEKRQLLTTATPWLDKDGRIVSALAIFRDETDRKRTEEALRRRAEELAALQATVLDITGADDLPILLQTIVERAARLLGAPAGGMYLCDPEKREARCAVSYNTPHDYTGAVLRYGEGAAGIVTQTGKPLIVDDYHTWQGRAAAFEEDRPFRAVLTVPMIWQGRVTGVIDVLDDTASRRFAQTDQELLTLFANHAAIAVENARLLEQEKRHAEELTRYSTTLEQLVFERTGKLAESERKYRSLVENIPDVVWTTDQKSNTVFISPNVESVYGYTPQEIYEGGEMLWLGRIHPEDIERVREAYGLLFTGKGHFDIEYRIQRKDGKWIWLHDRAIATYQRDGMVYADGVFSDITDRKRAEEELRAARERLDYLIKSNPAVIYSGKPLADRSDFVLTYMSERVVSMLGFEPREFIGHPQFWERHVHAEDLRPTLAEIPRLWKEGQHTFEFRFLHKNGTYRWIREEAKVVRDAGGRPIEVNGYWTDVTERKRMEEEIRASKERLEYIVASNPAVIFTAKPFSDYTDFDFTYVSSNIASMLGYDSRDFVDDPRFWSKHVHPDDRQRVATEIPRVFTEDHLDLEYRFRHRDGAYRWIREQNRLIRDKERRPQEVIGYWTDVTEWKRMEAELVKSQRFATIGETAAMVGHDLRNPLQAITGAVYYLATKDRPKLSREGRKMLQLIEESIGRSDKIIDDLLEYSRELHLELSETNVKSITQDALAKVKIPRRMRVVNSTKNEPTIALDVEKMRRVFLNLVRNAVDAMPKGGTLTIASTRSRDNVHITFKDTGEGMTTETLTKLWSPLYTTKAKGMGFGMAIAKRLVEAHAGSISVETKVGKGSTLTVTLPIKRKLEGKEVKKKRKNRNRRGFSS